MPHSESGVDTDVQGLIFADAGESAPRALRPAKPAVRKGGKSSVSDEDSDFSD